MNRLKSAKQATDMANRLRTLEENQKSYKQMVQQPLILALKSANPETAIALLEHGADPNAINSASQYYMYSYWHSHFTGESALDIANNHLKALRGYEGEATSSPSLVEGMDAYLEKFKEGTYQHWAVSKEIGRLRELYQKALKANEESKASSANTSGVKEKEAAIAEAITTMEKVKEALLAKGAKTFLEVHPEFKDRAEDNSKPSWRRNSTRKGDEPFKYEFSFNNVNDVTDARKEAYFKL